MIISLDFCFCAHDYDLFSMTTFHGGISLSLQDDNIIITSKCIDEIEELKLSIIKKFEMNDLSICRSFLTIEIAHSPFKY